MAEAQIVPVGRSISRFVYKSSQEPLQPKNLPKKAFLFSNTPIHVVVNWICGFGKLFQLSLATFGAWKGSGRLRFFTEESLESAEPPGELLRAQDASKFVFGFNVQVLKQNSCKCRFINSKQEECFVRCSILFC